MIPTADGAMSPAPALDAQTGAPGVTNRTQAGRKAYNAFISYSQAADGKLAPALQEALHRFAKPWYSLRAVHVFRDTTNLSVNPHLWSSIQLALHNSEYLLLMLALTAATVEVRRVINLRGRSRMYPAADPAPQTKQPIQHC